MYFNDIHILIYLALGLVGCLVGQLLGMVNSRLENHERILSRESLKLFKIEFCAHYGMMVTMFISYIAILYACGIDFHNWYANLKLISFLVLFPLLLSAFIIDWRKQIIPNRLVLTIFELGLILTFIYGIFAPTGMSLALNRLEGMFCGALIFMVITVLGGLIAGKEAMGMGDVKLMGALGLFFGMKNIIIISVLAFLIGAVASIFLLVFKIKKTDEYIPFGPFIVIAAVITMILPEELLFASLWYIFTGEWLMKVLKK